MGPWCHQLRAVMTVNKKMFARARMMTDGCAGPHVMHGPHHGLAAAQDAGELMEGEHALVDPVQMNDVCGLELGKLCDIRSTTCNIHFPQSPCMQTVGQENAKPLPEEKPLQM